MSAIGVDSFRHGECLFADVAMKVTTDAVPDPRRVGYTKEYPVEA
jgi:hypothetical protein